MKRLLDEKNASMDRMKRKLEEARAAGRGGGAADRNHAARLTDRQACLNIGQINRSRSHNLLYIKRCTVDHTIYIAQSRSHYLGQTIYITQSTVYHSIYSRSHYVDTI